MNAVIRKFSLDDIQKVLRLLRLNTPEYFAPQEEKDLIYYLEREREQYFVAENDEGIIGCGGINFKDNGKTGVLSWDIVHPQFHGKGVGAKLVAYRMDILRNTEPVNKIIVRTTQLVYAFYEKQGFELKHTEKDYWAKGLDLYYMELNNDKKVIK